MNNLHDSVDIKIVEVTPDMAKKFLSNARPNRNISNLTVSRYASDIKNGKWDTNPQGIAFDVNGEMIDGSHRCLAIIKAEIPVTMMITTGWPVTANKHIDQHYQRNASAAIQISYDADAQWLAKKDNMSTVKAVIEIVAGNTKVKPSIDAIIDIGESMKGEVMFVAGIPHTHKKGVTTAIVYGAMTMYLLKNGSNDNIKSKAERFLKILGGDATLGHEEIAAHTLSRWLYEGGATTNSSKDRITRWQCVYYFFDKFVSGEKITKIYMDAIKRNAPSAPDWLLKKIIN